MRKKLFSILLAIFLLTVFASGVFSSSIKDIENNITQAVKDYLIAKESSFADAKINIEYKYSWKTFKNLSRKKGKIQYEVAELYPGFKPLGNIIIPIQVIVDDVPKEKVFLRARVSVLKDVVTAKRSIRKKEVVGIDDVVLTERDIARVYSKNYFVSTEEVVDKEAKTYIPRNYIVIGWMVKEKSVVRRKDRVKIKANVGGVEVSADGEAMEDGPRGRKIKVKNILSNKIIMGTVVSSHEVTVENL